MSPEISLLWLFIAVIFGVEYWLKQFFENFSSVMKSGVKFYCFYRLINLVVLFSMIQLTFSTTHSWFYLLFVSLVFTLIGSIEIITSLINRLIQEKFHSKNRFLFFVAPFLMIIIISLIPINNFQLNKGILKIYQSINSTLLPLKLKGNFAIIVFSFFILLSNSTNYFIRWLTQFKNDLTLPDMVVTNLGKPNVNTFTEAAATQENVNLNLVKAGKTIGVLERWLFLFFVLINQYSAIGFIIAAKAVARFKNDDAKGKEFTEYSLTGTLYSTFFAVLAGVIILKVMV